MPGISRVNTDSAGGIIAGPGVPTVRVNGSIISVVGDSVTPHPPAPGPHFAGPVMVGKSSTVRAGGKGVVRAGDLASCGHGASGSSNVFAG